MNAKEFIKKFGWEEAIEVFTELPEKFKHKDLSLICYDNNTYKYSDRFKPRRSLINIADLKKYIDAYELVQSYGGLDNAKEYLNTKHIFEMDALDGQLSQAITLIEEI